MMELVKVDSETASKLKAIDRLCSTDEQLEVERSSVLRTTTTEPVSRELFSTTENIHVRWLFSPAGEQILKVLALHLDYRKPGWEDLATELGLTPEYIMDIKFNRYLDEGPTYTILCIYAYKDDATIGKVLEGLHHMKRYDIFSIIGEKGLIELLQSEVERWNNSGHVVNELNRTSIDDADSTFKLKLPPLPTKYKLYNSSTVAKIQNFSESIGERPICTERLITRCSYKPEEDHVIAKIPTKRTCYKGIVMLTFAKDGYSCAKSIASILRKERIGVLILDEHRDRLISNPELFITGFFPQVNYVIPIVTKDYLDALIALSLPQGALTSCSDARYVKLIYTLMANQYIQNGCINLNVRCIVPKGNECLMQEHPVVLNRPVLQAWLPEDDVNVLADSILSTAGPHSEE